AAASAADSPAPPSTPPATPASRSSPAARSSPATSTATPSTPTSSPAPPPAPRHRTRTDRPAVTPAPCPGGTTPLGRARIQLELKDRVSAATLLVPSQHSARGVPRGPCMARWIDHHPEYADLVAVRARCTTAVGDGRRAVAPKAIARTVQPCTRHRGPRRSEGIRPGAGLGRSPDPVSCTPVNRQVTATRPHLPPWDTSAGDGHHGDPVHLPCR